ncbi:unnamed protein product [Parajaminaea phylloscopi]
MFRPTFAARALSRGLRINADRLNATLHETCQWGQAHRYGAASTETGMRRLTLSDSDKQVRDWFVQETEKLGCRVTVDQMGNIFASRPGRKEAPPTAMGSHLDTQPSGGRYDGILGVQAALETLRVLHENDIETEYPVAAINWTNEEGARFPQSVVSSQVWAGKVSLQDAWNLRETPALAEDPARLRTQKEELERIGYLGSTECSYKGYPLAAHFELHIEQGPILESKGKKVGVVQGGQAYRWYTLDIGGQDAHTGATPYANRADALLLASHIMVENKRLSLQHGGLCSTGILTLTPGSTNTIPGSVRLTLDMRHPSTAALLEMDKALQEQIQRLASDRSIQPRTCSTEMRLDVHSDAVDFHADTIACVRQSAEALVGADMVEDIWSGAGHDSCAVSKRCPTSMIFIPCKGGVSHNPVEYSSPEECAVGTQVLLDSVLAYDQKRTA